MAKLIEIEIHNCYRCSYCGTLDCRSHFCRKSNRKKITTNIFTEIPDWCPLEDANNQINMDKLKPVLFELAHSHSLLAQAEYNRDPGYNDAHFSHKAENRLIEFMQEYKIFEEFLEWENETVRL